MMLMVLSLCQAQDYIHAEHMYQPWLSELCACTVTVTLCLYSLSHTMQLCFQITPRITILGCST